MVGAWAAEEEVSSRGAVYTRAFLLAFRNEGLSLAAALVLLNHLRSSAS